MAKLKHIELFTDGSCLGNPGPGGYGAVMRYGRHEKELAQGYQQTTNNRMEMMAAMIVGRFGAPASLDQQRAFFNRHIGPWASHFFTDLEGAKNAVFYAPVGTTGRAFMEIEAEAFRMSA